MNSTTILSQVDWPDLLRAAPRTIKDPIAIESTIHKSERSGDVSLRLYQLGGLTFLPWGRTNFVLVSHDRARVLAAYRQTVNDFLTVEYDWLADRRWWAEHIGRVYPAGAPFSAGLKKPVVSVPTVVRFDGNKIPNSHGLLLPEQTLVARGYDGLLMSSWEFVEAFAAIPLDVWQQAYQIAT